MRDEQEHDGYAGYAELGHEYAESADEEDAPRRPAAKRVLLVTAGGVFAALLAVGGYGAYTIMSAVTGGDAPGTGGRQGAATASRAPQEPPPPSRPRRWRRSSWRPGAVGTSRPPPV